MSEIQMIKYVRPLQLAGYNIKKMVYNQIEKQEYTNLNIEMSFSVVDTEKLKLDEIEVYQSVIELALLVKEDDNELFDVIIEGGYNSPMSIGKEKFEKYIREYALFELYIIVKQKIYEITSVNSFDTSVILPMFDFKSLSNDLNIKI